MEIVHIEGTEYRQRNDGDDNCGDRTVDLLFHPKLPLYGNRRAQRLEKPLRPTKGSQRMNLLGLRTEVQVVGDGGGAHELRVAVQEPDVRAARVPCRGIAFRF